MTEKRSTVDTDANDARLIEHVRSIHSMIDLLTVSPERREVLAQSVLRGDPVIEVHSDAERTYVSNIAFNRGITPRRLGTVCSEDYTPWMRFAALRAMGSE